MVIYPVGDVIQFFKKNVARRLHKSKANKTESKFLQRKSVWPSQGKISSKDISPTEPIDNNY